MRPARALAGGTVVLVVGLGALVLTNGDDDASPTGTPATADETDVPAPTTPRRHVTPGAIGDRLVSGGVQLVLQGVDDPFTTGDPVLTAPAGRRWVATDVEVTNLSPAPVTLSSQGHFLLRDVTDARYATAAGGGVPAVDGVLPAGATRRANLVFEVPEDARDLRLSFNGGPVGSDPILVSLG